jgi:hypothetical protein
VQNAVNDQFSNSQHPESKGTVDGIWPMFSKDQSAAVEELQVKAFPLNAD